MDDKDTEKPDWRRSASGLYVPAGMPDGGRKPTVGFARALGVPGSQPSDVKRQDRP